MTDKTIVVKKLEYNRLVELETLFAVLECVFEKKEYLSREDFTNLLRSSWYNRCTKGADVHEYIPD